MLLLATALALLTPHTLTPQAPDTTFATVYDEVVHTVEAHFFDPAYNGANWDSLKTHHAPQAKAAATPEAFAIAINTLLGELRTSHTRLYIPQEPAYYQLLDIFKDVGTLGERIRSLYADGEVTYPGIGMFTAQQDGSIFVSGLLGGGPAAAADLRVGDRIVDVDGAPYHPIRSFEGRVGEAVTVTVQRTADPPGRLSLAVVPERIQPGTAFMNALEHSIRLIEHDTLRIGYVRLWSYASQDYHDRLVEALAFGPLQAADALILDVRDGWGGASPAYLNLFNPNVPRLTQITRDGTAHAFDLQWRKPVALLVNEGTRSGKEVLAYGFQRYGLGPVVGSRTAGAVVFGRPFVLSNGMVLYLAVADGRVEGERLEGRGVVPDVEVAFPLPYAQGQDPQVEAAVAALVARLQK